ncbi:MAG: sigma-54 interaction domain-containing protein, partial [Blastocatellia bacterium]
LERGLTLAESPRTSRQEREMMPRMFDANSYAVSATPEIATTGDSAISKNDHSDCQQFGDGTLGIIGSSPTMKVVLDQIGIVSPTDATVLIQGETGTGKELVARAVHTLSARRNAPFITLNCAAIPDGLLESELFGHERGAFTGAIAQRKGRFESANGGTLFLDEIGEMSLDLQAKLLRVLQEKEFERLGSSRTCRVNVRVVAATNRDLPRMVDDECFRSDLYYRLSVFPVLLPPLRDRAEDIPALVRHFVDKYARQMNKVSNSVPSETMEAMLSYEWPGNIRELQNFIERGIIISRGTVFQPNLDELRRQRTRIRTVGSTLYEATRDHILRTLAEANWVIGGQNGAASRLGIPRTTLIAKMRRLGIEPPKGIARSANAAY